MILVVVDKLAILGVPATTIDPWFQLTQLPDDIWNYLEIILTGSYHITSDDAPAKPPTGVTHIRKLIGIPKNDKKRILQTVITQGYTLDWLAKECDTTRMIVRIHNAMSKLVGKEWKELTLLFPEKTSEEYINKWVGAFSEAKIAKAGRYTKYPKYDEIPKDFIEMCQRLKARIGSRTTALLTADNTPTKLQCDGEIIQRKQSEYGVLCTDIHQIGRKVFKDDYCKYSKNDAHFLDVITVHLPKSFQQAVNFTNKLAELIDSIKGLCNPSVSPVWFWICDPEHIGTIQHALEESGFSGTWNSVAVTTNLSDTKLISALGVVCGTYASLSAVKTVPQQTRVYSIPEFTPPLSTDTHEQVCKSALHPKLMSDLLGKVVKPGDKILELFARTGPAMEFALYHGSCSCVSVDSSKIVTCFLTQQINAIVGQLENRSATSDAVNHEPEDSESSNKTPSTSSSPNGMSEAQHYITLSLAFI